jgi:hypothetical protein
MVLTTLAPPPAPISSGVFQNISPAYGLAITQSRRPVQLVWSEYFDRVTDAIAVERKLKGWSRAKKHALIVDDWQSTSRLSKRRGGKPHSQFVILRSDREARAIASRL